MNEKFAYKIIDGTVVDGIIVNGVNINAQWAMENIGGFWVDSDTLAWIGGTWTQQEGFRPPQPSPDCWWDNDSWVCPEPESEEQS